MPEGYFNNKISAPSSFKIYNWVLQHVPCSPKATFLIKFNAKANLSAFAQTP